MNLRNLTKSKTIPKHNAQFIVQTKLLSSDQRHASSLNHLRPTGNQIAEHARSTERNCHLLEHLQVETPSASTCRRMRIWLVAGESHAATRRCLDHLPGSQLSDWALPDPGPESPWESHMIETIDLCPAVLQRTKADSGWGIDRDPSENLLYSKQLAMWRKKLRDPGNLARTPKHHHLHCSSSCLGRWERNHPWSRCRS